MKKSKIIATGVMGITVHGCILGWRNPFMKAKITSDLHEPGESSSRKAEWDAVESMVLGHAVAGIDITTPAYTEGLERTIQGIMDRSDC